ncbi:MAG TPA: hypothetical protein VJS65_13315 [Verrucomicrobiae bacterium]|nr:hypothetical protein [Verrucomicrobiae bacterium]
MKSRLFFALSICLSLATAGLFPAVAAELPPTGINSISGQLSLTNTDPDILARLGPPGDEGMYAFTIYAYTDPPEVLQSS